MRLWHLRRAPKPVAAIERLILLALWIAWALMMAGAVAEAILERR